MANLKLSIALTNNPRTWPVLDGRVKVDGSTRHQPCRPVGDVLAAAPLRRVRRVRDVDVVALITRAAATSASSACRSSPRGASSTPASWCGATQDRRARRPQGQARRRAGIPADGGAVGARRARSRFRRQAQDMEFWMERPPSAAMAAPPASSRRPASPSTTSPPTRVSARCWSRASSTPSLLFRRAQPDRPQQADLPTIPTSSRSFPTQPPRAFASTRRPALPDQSRHGRQAHDVREIRGSRSIFQASSGRTTRQRRAQSMSRIISRPACCRRLRRAIATPIIRHGFKANARCSKRRRNIRTSRA